MVRLLLRALRGEEWSIGVGAKRGIDDEDYERYDKRMGTNAVLRRRSSHHRLGNRSPTELHVAMHHCASVSNGMQVVVDQRLQMPTSRMDRRSASAMTPPRASLG